MPPDFNLYQFDSIINPNLITDVNELSQVVFLDDIKETIITPAETGRILQKMLTIKFELSDENAFNIILLLLKAVNYRRLTTIQTNNILNILNNIEDEYP